MSRTDEEEVDRSRNPAAEREVIGSVVRAPIHAEEAMRLRAEDFTLPLHQVAWRALAHLLDRGDPIRLQTLTAACGNAIDGQGRRDVENMVAMASGAEGMLREAIGQVEDASRRRAAAQAYRTAQRRAISSEDPIETTAARATAEVDEALHGGGVTFMDGHQVNRRLRERLQNPPRPVSTGIRRLDHALEGGLMPTRMVSFVAQTKIGKTTLAATISHNVLEIGEPHLVISLERNDTDIQQMCAARALGINALDLERDFARHEKGFDRWEADERHGLRHFEHRPGATIEDIQSAVLKAKRAGARGFILDYWQLIQRPARESVVDHLSRCAQTLANLTSRLGMWSVVNAQATAEGLPRECQTLWLASPTMYVIRRDAPDRPEAWLQCLGSSYTKGKDAGGPGMPAMMLDAVKGPHFASAD